MLILILITITIFIFLINYREGFKEDYSKYKENNEIKNGYLDIIHNVHKKFLEKLKSKSIYNNGPFRGTCNDVLNKKIQDESIKESLKLEKENCNEYASRICQEVDSGIMIINNKYANIKCIKLNPPKTLNNKCYNEILNCCKSI